MSKFAQKLKNSGYNHKFRQQVIDAGVKAHKLDVEKDRQGEKKLYRSRSERLAQKKPRRSRTKWWKNVREGESVPITFIKVPFTPGSKLLKMFQEVAKKHEFPIKFVETSGYSLQNLLEKSDPFREETCGRPDCFPCMSGGGGRCDVIGAAYVITCEEEECVARGVQYDGECFRPGYARGRDHLRGLRNKSKDSVLWKHCVNEHGGREDVKFVMKILKTYGRDNLTRLSNEGVRINFNKGVRLNSKAEFRQPSIPRVVIQRNNNE